MMNERSELTPAGIVEKLNATFGQYRAEYIEEDLFSFFALPNYWKKLGAVRPCILEGGRGTGKTTALRGMSYEGQYALRGASSEAWDSLGAYWRVESNVVSSFKGKKIDESEWNLYFSHYVNIQLCLLVLDFLNWRKSNLEIDPRIDGHKWNLLMEYFEVDSLGHQELREHLHVLLARFQMALLRPGRGEDSEIVLTPLGVPIKVLLEALAEDEDFANNYFAFCIDEYENLLPYQQHVINTLVKHTGDGRYTFKIGVKKYGIRDFQTLADGQLLQNPADYSLIDIAQEVRRENYSAFSTFAIDVCNRRLRTAFGDMVLPIKELFPALSEEEEARLLGVEGRVAEIRSRLEERCVNSESLSFFDDLDGLGAYLVQYWAETRSIDVEVALADAIGDPQAWLTRRGNYAYPMLFTLRTKVRGRVKYYSGWDTFVRMADGNIRLLLQLIYESLILHSDDGKDLSWVVDPEAQTRAAEKVGEQQVDALQGLSRIGGKLMQLVLSLGRIFEVMARQPHGHAPEVNQFRVNRSRLIPVEITELNELLKEAVMHSAVVPFVADKKSSFSGETNASDYMLHPITAAFFNFSDRKKRRMTIDGDAVLEMASDTASRAINKVLKAQRRSPQTELPEQLSIYSEFLHGDN